MRFTLILMCQIALGVATLVASAAARAELNGFVTARGDQLIEAGKPFRFISFNIPNLQLVEDNLEPDAERAWGWPNEFELNDALESVRQMGGTVARTYVLSVRREGADMGDHVYVRGPGDFNEEAFRSLDLALEIANKKGVRLIIPLVDNWHWQGGIAEYAAFRGKPPAAFWTDEQIIADFEKTIEHLLTRVNTRTGVAYRDDPAILGWETGNELDAPPEWTSRIARFIKSLDPNHLVIDGYSLHGVREESLADTNIDVVTTHHYPNVGKGEYIDPIRAAREKSRGRKPYFVGEFGFIPPEEIEAVYDEVIKSGVSGALLWSLRYHHRNGGFYWHSEPAGGGIYRAYHWPGFDAGAPYGEREVLRITRDRAYAIRGMEPPSREVPAAPRMLPIEDVAAISWQGAAGAASYMVERATNAAGPWSVVANEVDDAAVQYRPLFSDVTAEPGGVYFYRVFARNEAGESAPSNVIGPVAVASKVLVDEYRDLAQAFETNGNARIVTGNDRSRREDLSRLELPAGSGVVYRLGGPITSLDATLFISGDRQGDAAAMEVLTSSDGKTFTRLPVTATPLGGSGADADYGYLPRLQVQADKIPSAARYVQIVAREDVELSTLTIHFKPARQAD